MATPECAQIDLLIIYLTNRLKSTTATAQVECAQIDLLITYLTNRLKSTTATAQVEFDRIRRPSGTLVPIFSPLLALPNQVAYIL
jgi:hypothetical protein